MTLSCLRLDIGSHHFVAANCSLWIICQEPESSKILNTRGQGRAGQGTGDVTNVGKSSIKVGDVHLEG